MSPDQIDLPGPLAELTEAFQRYETALVTNDVATLTELFHKDARTIRYGIGENLYGHDAITAFRQARDPAWVARTISGTRIITFGEDFGVAMTLFHRDEGKIGRQSQTWAKIDGLWKVVAAHVSVIPAAEEQAE